MTLWKSFLLLQIWILYVVRMMAAEEQRWKQADVWLRDSKEIRRQDLSCLQSKQHYNCQAVYKATGRDRHLCYNSVKLTVVVLSYLQPLCLCFYYLNLEGYMVMHCTVLWATESSNILLFSGAFTLLFGITLVFHKCIFYYVLKTEKTSPSIHMNSF